MESAAAWLASLPEPRRREVWLDLMYANQDDLDFVKSAAKRLQALKLAALDEDQQQVLAQQQYSEDEEDDDAFASTVLAEALPHRSERLKRQRAEQRHKTKMAQMDEVQRAISLLNASAARLAGLAEEVDPLAPPPPATCSVLVVSSEMAGYELLLDAVRPDIACVPYRFQETCMSDLLQLIRTAIKGRIVEQVGIAMHSASGTLRLASDAIMDLESIKSPAMASFWQELAEMVPIGTIHVFAARLTCHADGLALLQRIRVVCPRPVSVSDDLSYVLGDAAGEALDPAAMADSSRQAAAALPAMHTEAFFDLRKLGLWRQFLHVTMDLLTVVRTTLRAAVHETFRNMTELAWSQMVATIIGWDAALSLQAVLAPIREWLAQLSQDLTDGSIDEPTAWTQLIERLQAVQSVPACFRHSVAKLRRHSDMQLFGTALDEDSDEDRPSSAVDMVPGRGSERMQKAAAARQALLNMPRKQKQITEDDGEEEEDGDDGAADGGQTPVSDQLSNASSPTRLAPPTSIALHRCSEMLEEEASDSQAGLPAGQRALTVHEQLFSRLIKLRAGAVSLRDLISMQDDLNRFDADKLAEAVAVIAQAPALALCDGTSHSSDAGGVVMPSLNVAAGVSQTAAAVAAIKETQDEGGLANLGASPREALIFRLCRSESAFCGQLRALERLYARPIALVLRDRTHGIDPLARSRLDRGSIIALDELWDPVQNEGEQPATTTRNVRREQPNVPSRHTTTTTKSATTTANKGRNTGPSQLGSSKKAANKKPGHAGRLASDFATSSSSTSTSVSASKTPTVTIVREEEERARQVQLMERRLMSLSDFVAIFWDTLALAEVHEACGEDLDLLAEATRLRQKLLPDGPTGAEITVGLVLQQLAAALKPAFRDWLTNIGVGLERLQSCLEQSNLLRMLMARARQDSVSQQHALQSLLLLPLTRPSYYVMMTEDLLRLTPEHHVDRLRLSEALAAFRSMAAEAQRVRQQLAGETAAREAMNGLQLVENLSMPRMVMDLGLRITPTLQLVRRLTLYVGETLASEDGGSEIDAEESLSLSSASSKRRQLAVGNRRLRQTMADNPLTRTLQSLQGLTEIALRDQVLPEPVDALVAVAEVNLYVMDKVVVVADVWEEVKGLGAAVVTRQLLRAALRRDSTGMAVVPQCAVVGGPVRDALVMWPRSKDAVLQGYLSQQSALYFCADSSGALYPLVQLLLGRGEVGN